MPITGVNFPAIPAIDTAHTPSNVSGMQNNSPFGSHDLLSVMTKALLADLLLAEEDDEKKKGSSMAHMALDMYMTASALQNLNASYNQTSGAIEPATANNNMAASAGITIAA